MPTPPHALGSKDFDPVAFLSKAGGGKTLQRCRRDQKIFIQGEEADAVFFIRSGKVKITVLSEHGKEAVIGFLTNHQFFGEGCLDGSKLRAGTSRAVEDCLITSITKAAMRAALVKEPKFSTYFLTYLLSRNTRIEDDLIDSCSIPANVG